MWVILTNGGAYKGGAMWCAICNNQLHNCTCVPSAAERLSGLKNDPNLIYKMCRKCEKHYSACKCEEPDWTTSHDGVELEDVKNMPTVKDVIESKIKGGGLQNDSSK